MKALIGWSAILKIMILKLSVSEILTLYNILYDYKDAESKFIDKNVSNEILEKLQQHILQSLYKCDLINNKESITRRIENELDRIKNLNQSNDWLYGADQVSTEHWTIRMHALVHEEPVYNPSDV